MQFLVTLAALISLNAHADIKGFKCLGTEPFFSLKIQDQQMSLETPDGLNSQIQMNTPITPAGLPEGAVAVYKSPDNDVVVSIVYGKCSDGMSDNEYAFHMVYVKGSGALYGCCDALPEE